MDAELLKQLMETFKAELDEQLQVITTGLLDLEKPGHDKEELQQIISSVFRSAHNIKGAARSIGINDIGEISHQIESLFSNIQHNEMLVTSDIINLCLEAVDSMRSAMQSISTDQPLAFDLADLVQRLKKGEAKATPAIMNENEMQKTPAITEENSEYETIRISVTNLDKVSALMEEMQVNKISIDDHYRELTKLVAEINQLPPERDQIIDIQNHINQLYKNLRPRINELTILSNSLQEEVRMLRLVPVSLLLNTFPRLVRDLAQSLNKRVELVINGGDAKIDKMVLEGLKDPIIHLLRNAIDHGIETGEERKALKKPEIAKITLNIKEESNLILFDISDDGRGINEALVASKAVEKNLINDVERDNMSRAEILELLFRPGFSTKEEVTNVSGRGVGLDVVKSNISNLKGFVTVTSQINQGTTFHLRVPLTLSSERGLLVRCNHDFFVIPTSSVIRVLNVTNEEIIEVQGSQAILLDKHPLPLRALADILSINKSLEENLGKLPIVILKKDWQKVALLVDEIIGEREIVIKPLQAPLHNIACVAGGTLSGNGQVIVVLNPGELVNKSFRAEAITRVDVKEEAITDHLNPHILVVDDSITTRTLEKNILESRNYKVTVAVNGKDAWDILQTQRFALMVTDVTMPLMDGFTLTEKVKTHPELNQMPVVIVTSLDTPAEKKRGVEVGANAYIVKSEFESGALLEIVSQLV